MNPSSLPENDQNLFHTSRIVTGFSLVGIFSTSISLVIMIFFPHLLPTTAGPNPILIASIPFVTSCLSYLSCVFHKPNLGALLLMAGTYIGLMGQVINEPNPEIAHTQLNFFYIIPLLCSLIYGRVMTLLVTIFCAITICFVRTKISTFPAAYTTLELISLSTGAGLAAMGSAMRRAAEKKLHIQRSKTLASAKLSSLGEIAGGVAHEINNPLAVILGKIRSLKAQTAAENPNLSSISQGLEVIEKMSERIAKIVNSFLTFSGDCGKDVNRTVYISQIFETCLTVCQERFKNAGIEFTWELPTEPLSIDCCPSQICQVILNLLTNSYDAVQQQPQKWIRLTVVPKKNEIQFAVTDSGPSIPPKTQAKLFQPFLTTKDMGIGTGLGLSSSVGIIKKHGGKIWLDSESKHTRFVFTIHYTNQK